MTSRRTRALGLAAVGALATVAVLGLGAEAVMAQPEEQHRRLSGSMFASMKAEVDAGRAEILDYYHGDKELLDIEDLGRHDNDMVIVSKMAERIAKTKLREKQDRAFSGNKWVIGHLGSSVTAGHDGFGTTAYPAAMGRALGPIFEKVGLNLDVRNAAVGGRGPWMEGSICLENQLGDDVDIIVREWEYWSLEDGSQDFGIHQDDASPGTAAVEFFLRQALRLSNQPAVHFMKLTAGHKREGEVTPHSKVLAADIFDTHGPLHSYSRFAINGLTSFGNPFDHLREQYEDEPRGRRRDGGKSSCSASDKPNVADCPVIWEKQDGYHERAQYLGYDEAKYPTMFRNQPIVTQQLYVNWHPAVLGHEVTGNQLAYLYSRHLSEALDKLDKLYSELHTGDELDTLTAMEKALALEVAPEDLPAPQACEETWCEYNVKCAYSTAPHWGEGGTIEDWVYEEDTSTWTRDGPPFGPGTGRQPWSAEDQAVCDLAEADPEDSQSVNACFKTLMMHSQLDEKRGASGHKKDGRLQLKIDNSEMFKCMLVVGENTYGWTKPTVLANWHYDMKFYLNGEPITKEQYKITHKGHQQYAVFDLRELMGGACRREDVILGIEVDPLPVDELHQLDACTTRQGNCAAHHEWGGYDSKLCGKNGDGECGKYKAFRDADEVRAVVSYIFAY
uniref:Uncharacterized protein n=1 Tax=Phaeomonas parva TaxID=124430 RepID=A0A6U4GJY9_9STRA|mmetsp:Transcript_31159/g.98941  ORF Transcript_31159/g.98941 Transcript_31159/m.98941 type:complete len:674 (+) Transcript_31159:246-2267(+)|eukprot:CAMPEP_0118854510 /NCGR_PEP_ID=MMETSP1163-20130328/2696_1 /TAXON_ID=124430 /ORGANISM="Phaeomonas parva, Strain CCMP2877" /LENGTH=673 /DNA_ID=CAMNT_0006787245 /DNA_START=232 /DNA_END=2253 /DNA_ORIENTATION=-